jgi:hypothetical protein
MNKQERRTVAALQHAIGFFEAHARELGPKATIAPLVQLREAVAGIMSDNATEDQSRQQQTSGTAELQELREILCLQMGPIAAIAQAGLVGVPEAKMSKFRAPDTKSPDLVLIGAALGMAAAADDIRAAFQANGMGPDFVEALIAAARALERAVFARDNERLRRSGAGFGIDHKLEGARGLLRVLSKFVLEHLRKRPDLVRKWRQAIRIGRLGSVPESAEGKAPPELKLA